jgi:hypothetical protein
MSVNAPVSFRQRQLFVISALTLPYLRSQAQRSFSVNHSSLVIAAFEIEFYHVPEQTK